MVWAPTGVVTMCAARRRRTIPEVEGPRKCGTFPRRSVRGPGILMADLDCSSLERQHALIGSRRQGLPGEVDAQVQVVAARRDPVEDGDQLREEGQAPARRPDR